MDLRSARCTGIGAAGDGCHGGGGRCAGVVAIRGGGGRCAIGAGVHGGVVRRGRGAKDFAMWDGCPDIVMIQGTKPMGRQLAKRKSFAISM